MNSRSGQRYVMNSDGGEQALGNPTTTEDHVAKERQSFRYDFVDHLSRVPAKISVLDQLKLDRRTRKMLIAVLASVEEGEGDIE